MQSCRRNCVEKLILSKHGVYLSCLKTLVILLRKPLVLLINLRVSLLKKGFMIKGWLSMFNFKLGISWL